VSIVFTFERKLVWLDEMNFASFPVRAVENLYAWNTTIVTQILWYILQNCE